jgi:hypothetical protein
MNRCLHCGEPVHGFVCGDYPECIALKGMYPRAVAENVGALSRGDIAKTDSAVPSASVPSAILPTGESKV